MGLSFTDRALGLVLGAAAILGFILVVTKFINEGSASALLTPPQPPVFLPQTPTPTPPHIAPPLPPTPPAASQTVPSTTATISELAPPAPPATPQQGVTGQLTLSVSPAQSQRVAFY